MELNSFNEVYFSQLHLVLKILPSIAKEGTFALKGGTAINLFERGLPRLSVDIDLVIRILPGVMKLLTLLHLHWTQ